MDARQFFFLFYANLSQLIYTLLKIIRKPYGFLIIPREIEVMIRINSFKFKTNLGTIFNEYFKGQGS